MVEQHAAVGTLHVQIAKILGVALNTMKRYYRSELDLGLARANAVVASTLFAQAKGGNITAAMGIPTLDGLGPQGDGLHAVHEHVVINSLPQRAARGGGPRGC